MLRVAFTAITRVQIPSGTPIKNQRDRQGFALHSRVQKGHDSVSLCTHQGRRTSPLRQTVTFLITRKLFGMSIPMIAIHLGSKMFPFCFPEDLLACSFRRGEPSSPHQRCGLEYFADALEFICVDPVAPTNPLP